jgi:hypothetical protein
LHLIVSICVKNVTKRKKRIMYEICLVDITLIMAICLTYYMIGI